MVNLMDLGPTFLDAAGVPAPDTMTARSLLPVLESDRSGQVDPSRDFVVTGRERHAGRAREGNLPYPHRAIRTPDYLYIINFEPDRWPMGDPRGLDDPATVPPSYDELCRDTFIAYADLDASPTKAWMIHHRADETVQPLYKIGFGKRPSEELYDVHADPDHMCNLADDPAYADTRRELHDRLMAVLREQCDPRVVESPCRFEQKPYAGSAEW